VTPHCGSTPRVSSNGLSTSATKFAEPSNDRAVRFIQRWSKKAAIHFLCPFLACALGEQRKLPSLSSFFTSYFSIQEIGFMRS
jgi:hypothetical protein